MSRLRRWLPLFTLAVAVCALYLYRLDGVGTIPPDEPRYTAIGRAMAHTGDLITPRLWGLPWFEKPPLYFWMAAAGTWAGLNPDLCGRLPVCLLSLSFLAAYFFGLKSQFGSEAAGVATTLLATSAGWLAYSSFGLTDVPLSVFFSLAVFCGLRLLETDSHSRLWLALLGASLGLAALAKGLVPFALAVPLGWYLRRRWKSWWIAILTCLAVAGPWYGLVYARNGYPFIAEFFLKHHFERLYSKTLEHVQPWWFYAPVLLAALFPWTPALALLLTKRQPWDLRRQYLLAIAVFGFLFFSVSLNKLPGYLLPLIPSLFALIGSHFETRSPQDLSRAWLLPAAFLIALLPVVSHVLPIALAGERISLASAAHFAKTDVFYAALPIAVVLVSRRSWRGVLLTLCLVSGGIYLKDEVYPALDHDVSPRGLWRDIERKRLNVCDSGLHRNWQYGLAFYRGAPILPCSGRSDQTALIQQGNRPPQLVSSQ